jgi:hypothetical protein
MSDVILDFKNKNKDFDVKCKEEIVNYIKEKFL